MELVQVAELYLKLQIREGHPEGKFDNKGRWYPADEEAQPCCANIRNPSKHWPHSLLLHCRTAVHLARKYGVDLQELQAEIRKQRPAFYAVRGMLEIMDED